MEGTLGIEGPRSSTGTGEESTGAYRSWSPFGAAWSMMELDVDEAVLTGGGEESGDISRDDITSVDKAGAWSQCSDYLDLAAMRNLIERLA